MQIPLTTKVERYLFQCFRRRGDLPDRIPSEQELCERLGVSLIIVRRAIANMVEHGYLIRLPGRKGAFTNPDSQLGAKYAIGFFTQGSMQDFHCSGRQFLSSFLNDLGTAPCSIEFFLIPSEEKEVDWIRTVHDLSLDGAIIYHPIDKSIKQLDALLRTDFPCVTVLSDWKIEYEIPTQKYIGIDLADFGLQRAKLVENLKNVVYISRKNFTFFEFEKERKKKAKFIHLDGDIAEKLGMLLKERKVDAIISDGVYWMLREQFQILNSEPEYSKIPVYVNMDPSLYVEFERKYPNLNIVHVPDDRGSLFKKQGSIAAKEILKMLTDQRYNFKGTLLKDTCKINHAKENNK